jgi:hypothetical protein
MIPLGLPQIDAALKGGPGGVRPHWFALLSGAHASGKSSFLQTLAVYLTECGHHVLYVPLNDLAQSVLEAVQRQHGALPEKLLVWSQSLLTPQALSQAVAAEKKLDIVLVDGLEHLQPNEDVAQSLHGGLGPPYDHLTARLWDIAHKQDVFLLATTDTRQQAGMPFAAGQAVIGSKGIDRSDLAFQIWQPARKPGITEAEVEARRYQFMLKLVKNRYGPEASQALLLDPETGALRPVDSFIEPELAGPTLVPFQLTRPSGLSERLVGSA